MRQIARHGQEKRYYHVRVGMNSRLDTIQAAILQPKLAILDDEIAARQRLADAYAVNLRAIGIAPPHIMQHNVSAWAQYTIRVPNRDAVQKALAGPATPRAVHYPLPLTRHPAVAAPAANLPHGDRAAVEVLSLPMHPYLGEGTVSRIVDGLRSNSRG